MKLNNVLLATLTGIITACPLIAMETAEKDLEIENAAQALLQLRTSHMAPESHSQEVTIARTREIRPGVPIFGSERPFYLGKLNHEEHEAIIERAREVLNNADFIARSNRISQARKILYSTPKTMVE